MAEPTNTPIPASTPRAASPAPAFLSHAHSLSHSTTISSPLSPTFGAPLASRPSPKPRVLHIGDPIKYNPETYADFTALFDVVRPSAAERERDAFKQALAEKRWGDFQAVFRPFWGTGGEMGNWDAELIGLLPASVRVFAAAGAGFDWADTKLLGERGIIYCNAGLAAAQAVGDFAIAMIISTFRHLPWCLAAATSSSPSAFQACHAHATAHSHGLSQQHLGIIGLGNIGHAVADRAYHGFGMRVHYYDIERKDPELEMSLGARYYPELKEMLAVADCVVLATPRSEAEDSVEGKMINKEVLGWFKPGARFVNVARGSLVDEDALADALEAGHLTSAALDVHEREPEVNPRLRQLASLDLGPGAEEQGQLRGRVMLTCHNAGGTRQTHEGFEELSMRNIMAVLGGGQAISPVNLQWLRRG